MLRVGSFIVLTAFVLAIALSFLPVSLAETVPSGPASVWPSFLSYTLADGTPIIDPGGESGISPVQADITSGLDRGYGRLPTVFLGSDGDHFFVRFRVKADPRSDKGGFASSVWLAQIALAESNTHVATIGLNGKSPHVDYVYVADASGANIQVVYQTTVPGGSTVPGTRVTEAENGHYFLDFQVPIAVISQVVPQVQRDTLVKLFYGTSQAANLSVINKEWMETSDNNNSSTSFINLAPITLEDPYSHLNPVLPGTFPLVAFDSPRYTSSTNNLVVTGTTSLTEGNVTFELNGVAVAGVQAPVANGTWSINLQSLIPAGNGTYLLTAVASENGKTARANAEVVVNSGTGILLTIDGGGLVYTSNPLHPFTGTVSVSGAWGNNKVRLYLAEGQNPLPSSFVQVGDRITPDTKVTPATWAYTLIAAEALTPGPDNTPKIYTVEARWTDNNNSTTHATTRQTLVYIPANSATRPLTVSIDSVQSIISDAQPAISGSSQGAELIELRIDGKTVEFVVPDANGNWFIDSLVRPLSPGNHTLMAIAIRGDEAAVASTIHTVTSTAITIDNGASVTTNDNSPRISGATNAPNTSDITVTIRDADGTVVFTGTVKPENGRWSISTTTLPDGIYTVTASVGGATAVQTMTIDTGTYVTILGPSGLQDVTTPVYSGTAEPGSSIFLVVRDASNQVVLVSSGLVASGGGNWLYAPGSLLDPGVYSLVALSADDFGNEASDQSSFTIASEDIEYPIITFNSNGGSAVLPISQESGTPITKPADPTKLGHSFAGWYSDAALTQSYTFSTMPAEDITLYAKWDVNDYTISFESNGGSAVDSITQDFGTVVVKPADPTKLGHSFAGWYSDAALTQSYTFSTMPAEDITLYAKWDVNVYTISFESNGGSSVDSINQDFGTVVVKPADPSKLGHSFAGWYSDAALTQSYTFSTMPAGDITLYAKWDVNAYTISFESNGGSAVDSINQDFGTAVVKPADPTKLGHSFAGWYSDAALTQSYTFSTMPAGDITLYAKWDVNAYTISFESNGGSSVDSINQDFGTVVVKPADPSKLGHSFAGWYSDAALTQSYTFSTMPAGDITLYAKWDVNAYTISFESNGGSSVDSINQDFGTAVVKPADPTKLGHSFAGWYSDAALTQTYTFSTMPAGDITLYAKWDVNAYTISFESNGGSSVDSINQDFGTAVVKPADPTKLGHSFAGWYSDAALTQSYTFSTMPAGDITLYAKWDVNSYTISFESNGGSSVDSITQDFGTAVVKPANPTKSGYYFAGWYSDEALTVRYLFSTMPASDLVLYARWVSPGSLFRYQSASIEIIGILGLDFSVDIAEYLLGDNHVEVILTLEELPELAVPSVDLIAIGEKLIADPLAQKLGIFYLDIYLTKIVRAEGVENQYPVDRTDNPIVMTIEIPKQYQGASQYWVIRVHQGQVEYLPATYDPVNKRLTFQSDRFSTYAVAYPLTEPGDNLPGTGTRVNWLIPVGLLLLAAGIGLTRRRLLGV